MNREEWASYEMTARYEPVIKGSEFVPPTQEQGMRLLCRGWEANGGPNIRIWLRFDGQIGVQRNDGDILFKEQWYTSSLYPSKRAYREDTDLLFATLMRERHSYPLSFTSWQT